MRRSIVPVLGVAAGIGAVAVTRRRAVDDHDRFYEWEGERTGLCGDGPARFSLPQTGHRTEQVISIHAAAYEPVRSLLPTDELYPVRLPGGRALLAMSAARYLEGTADGMDPHTMPYGESIITVLVTPEPARPLVPLLRGLLPGRGAPQLAGFMIHAAVSDRGSRDMSRALGYPAFTADFAFEDGLVERRVRVFEDGRDIYRLRVATRGRYSIDRRPMRMYNVRGDELVEAICPCSGIVQQALGRGAGLLELGDHPVADQLRALEVSSVPIMTRSYVNLRLLVPPQRVVGRARPFPGYGGGERDFGTYTIRYPDGSMIDLSAPKRATAQVMARGEPVHAPA
jgi:hypothetical protein